MKEKVLKYIERNALFDKKSNLLVAVSGGIDSVALLHFLVTSGFKCSIAHCNFHLRGEESIRDANFVKKIAELWSLPLYQIEYDTKNYATANKISIEMAARNLRYEWFDELKNKHFFDSVVVAHHIDDNVETFFINLLRGTGIEGLTGMKPLQGYISRPFLSITRMEVEQYILDHDLSYCQDSTNCTTIYIRNKIRHDIIPYLKEINPSFDTTMYQNMNRLNDVANIYKYYMNDAMQIAFAEEHGKFIIDLHYLLNTPSPKSLLFEILKKFGVSSSLATQIYNSLELQSGKLFFTDTHKIVKDRDTIIITPNVDEQPRSFLIDEGVEKLYSPVELTFENIVVDDSFQIERELNNAFLDADKLDYPLELRRWKEGDTFLPFGMKGKQKLSDFFINLKLSIPEKEKVWILTSNGEIIWVVGYRIDQRFAISKTTKTCVKITKNIYKLV